MHLVITFNYVIRSHTKQVSKKRRFPLNLDLEVSPLVVCNDGAFHSELLAFFKAVWITTKPFASLSHIRYTLFYSPSNWIVGETQSTTFVVCLLFSWREHCAKQCCAAGCWSNREVQERKREIATEEKAARRAEELFNCTAYPILVKVTENCTPLFIEVRRKSTQFKTTTDPWICTNTSHIIQKLKKKKKKNRNIFPCEGKVFASGKVKELYNMHAKILSS